MAQRVTRSYRRFKQLWGRESKARLQMHRHPLAFEQCISVDDHRTHERLVNRLASTGEVAIVVAASGMCQGGRIMDFLKALLPDKRTDLILAGFPAEGTLGRSIQSGQPSVWIEGLKWKSTRIFIRCPFIPPTPIKRICCALLPAFLKRKTSAPFPR